MAYDNLGEIELQRGNFAVAWEALQRCRELKPTDNVEVYHSLGEWYFGQQRYVEAEAALQKAMREEGSALIKGFSANLLGAIAVTRKDYPGAAAWFETSTRYIPKYTAAWLNLEHIEKILGDGVKEQAAAGEVKRLEDGE